MKEYALAAVIKPIFQNFHAYPIVRTAMNPTYSQGHCTKTSTQDNDSDKLALLVRSHLNSNLRSSSFSSQAATRIMRRTTNKHNATWALFLFL